MWAWMGKVPKVVHAVEEMRWAERGLFWVHTRCGATEKVDRLYPDRPGKSFDLCEKCDPHTSSRVARKESA